MASNCNLTGLEEYIPSTENPWDLKKLHHLYKRISLGISPDDVPALLEKSPSEVIDDLIDGFADIPLTDPLEEDYILNVGVAAQLRVWSEHMFGEFREKPIQAQLFLFWHNHFVAQSDRPRYVHAYTSFLQEYSLGNFRDFTRAIGLMPQMLRYLNGHENIKDAPNENYARELYELFTLGEGNGYTENDIVETARALTGYNEEDGEGNDRRTMTSISFVEENWDDGEKTIFGRTGNWGYDDVIDILFEEKAELISIYITETIYKHFVNPDLPEGTTIIEELAQTFRDNDFELIPLFKQLLKSEHFFDTSAMNVIIKSPIDQGLGLHISANLSFFNDIEDSKFKNFADDLSQSLYGQPDVSGWPGDRDWISSPNFINTWSALPNYIDFYFRNGNRSKEDFRNLALVVSSSTTDYKVVSNAIMDWFLPSELLTDLDYEIAQEVFKSNLPDNYYEEGQWDLVTYGDVPYQVSGLIKHIIKLPAFYLK